MIGISGSIRLESEDEVARVSDALARRAARSRKDAGNIDYVFSQNLEDRCEIRLYEKWESESSLEAHLKIPDEEFAALLANAKIERAVIDAAEIDKERWRRGRCG